MLDTEEIARLRAMTPGERLRMAMDLSELFWSAFDLPTKEIGARKWQAWLLEHDASTRNMLEALGRHREAEQRGGL